MDERVHTLFNYKHLIEGVILCYIYKDVDMIQTLIRIGHLVERRKRESLRTMDMWRK